MVDRNELWAEAEELADLIIQCPEIQAYRVAELGLSKNKPAQALIRRLEELNEQVGDFISRRVPEHLYKHMVEESESVIAQLEKIPDVVAFQKAQTAVNTLLTEVTSRLSQAVTTRVTDAAP